MAVAVVIIVIIRLLTMEESLRMGGKKKPQHALFHPSSVIFRGAAVGCCGGRVVNCLYHIPRLKLIPPNCEPQAERWTLSDTEEPRCHLERARLVYVFLAGAGR